MSQVFIPESIEETCDLLSTPGRMLCAGATNLYVDRYFGKYLDVDLISLHKLEALKQIYPASDGWHIGSMCSFDMLEQVFLKKGVLDALSKASSLVGGPQVRNRGTIGGNLVSASPSADSVPVLMALDASVILLSKHGIRKVAVRDFMTGVKKTAIRFDELLAEVVIPEHSGSAFFQKIGKRNALAIALCNICVYGKIQENVLEEISIAIGSCAPTCVRASHTEAALKGMKKPLNDSEWMQVKEKIALQLTNDISPIDDVRTSASYRSKVAANIVYRLVKKVWEVSE